MLSSTPNRSQFATLTLCSVSHQSTLDAVSACVAAPATAADGAAALALHTYTLGIATSVDLPLRSASNRASLRCPFRPGVCVPHERRWGCSGSVAQRATAAGQENAAGRTETARNGLGTLTRCLGAQIKPLLTIWVFHGTQALRGAVCEGVLSLKLLPVLTDLISK